MHRLSSLGTIAALLAIVYISCTSQVEEEPEKVMTKPVMREVSDLVLLMFKMEGDLKLIRSVLNDDSTFSQIGKFNYEEIFTADASADVRRDSVYVVNGTSYLMELHHLTACSNRDSALVYYNKAIAACVTCHQSYCPEPVARIEKLAIN